MRPTLNTLKLPAKLVDELGGRDVLSGVRKGHSNPTSRKERRKAERGQKRVQQTARPAPKRQKVLHDKISSSESEEESPLSAAKAVKVPLQAEKQKSKPILKIGKKQEIKDTEMVSSIGAKPSSDLYGTALRKLNEDDAEIAFLEKKLGIKGKKGQPKAYWGEDLDEILRDLDRDDDDDEVLEKRTGKAEGDEWIAEKRRKARSKQALVDDINDNSHGEPGMSMDEPHSDEERIGRDSNGDDALWDDRDEFVGFESASDADSNALSTSPQRKRQRENPFVAPISNSNIQSIKYIPPSLRKPSSADTESFSRLRRQIQGLANRLTEANLISILRDIEALYRDNPRQRVTSTLIDLLLTSVCEPTSLPDTLVILPAGFIAAVYRTIGTDFGAQIIERAVQLFEDYYIQANKASSSGPAAATSGNSKETSNLITLLAELYNFKVIGSNLMFDYIRLFLDNLTELNAELLLKLIKTSGPQLRQEDPLSLKDIVSMIRPAVSRAGEANLSVRTKFMIETINDLKNNRMKTGAAASAVTSEHTIRMKKILGTLNARNIKASEPLRLGLQDILQVNKKGKWWLVGARWTGNETDDTNHEEAMEIKQRKAAKEIITSDESGPLYLAELAREQRMNTDIRRAIFITIMSASDYQDAGLRIRKLKLKKAQELEIPKVLLHCASAEKVYNPYYSLIAKKLCGDRKLKMAFQFCLWNIFKKLDEDADEEDVDTEADQEVLDSRQLVNLAKMYGMLIMEGALSFSVLKILNLSYLQPRTKTFIEVLMITLFLQSQKSTGDSRDEQAIRRIVEKAKDTPQLSVGLHHFLKSVVSKTDLAGGKLEKATVKWACRVAADALDATDSRTA